MAQALDLPEALVVAKFWVEIHGIVQAYFRECSGLQMETHVESYEEGGLNGYTHQFPGHTTVGRVTLRKGVVEPDTIWNWYRDVVSGRIERRTITIHAYENRVGAPGNTAVYWVMSDALPVKWVGPTFTADQNATAVDQLEFVCGALTRQAGS